MGTPERIPMNRYRLTVVQSGKTGTLVVYSPVQDSGSIGSQFTPNPTVETTEGFIDDRVEGDPIYEYEAFGKRHFRDREGALRHLDQLQPQLTAITAELIAAELAKGPECYIMALFGYTLHYWHPKTPQQEDR